MILYFTRPQTIADSTGAAGLAVLCTARAGAPLEPRWSGYATGMTTLHSTSAESRTNPTRPRWRPLVLGFLVAVLPATPLVSAPSASNPSAAPVPHTLGEGYIFLSVHADRLEGRVELHLDDVARRFPMDLDRDGKVSGVEFAAQSEAIRGYVAQGIDFTGPFVTGKLSFQAPSLTPTALGKYVVVPFRVATSMRLVPGKAVDPPPVLTVEYDVVFDVDPDHLGVLVTEANDVNGVENNIEAVSLVFDNGSRSQPLDLTKNPLASVFIRYIELGIEHIWIGIDHILFLVALLLPAVLLRRERKWEPTPSFRSSFINVVKVVTLFTVAHSLTLSLAALQLVELSSRLVESIIAASIAIAAADNIWPIFGRSRWTIVFGFGLFHGFGFASVLGGLGLRQGALLSPLAGFNIGVELGQVAIIVVLFPLLFVLRKATLYGRAIVPVGSVGLIAMAIYWFVERAFELGT